MPKLQDLTIENLQELKDVWLHAWCVALQSHSIKDSESAAVWADASVETYAKNRQQYRD
jgi:hypothetical protein